MDIIFNELSLSNPPKIRALGIESITRFVEQLETIAKIRKQIYVRAILSLKEVDIAENYALMTWLKQRPDKLAFFLSILTPKPLIKDYPPYYLHEGSDCLGLGIAHENNSFSISFNHSGNWSSDSIELTKYYEYEDEIVEEKAITKHFGAINSERIREHLAEKGQMLPYDCDTKYSPRDNQTILFDESKFKFTKKHYSFGEGKKTINRKIYQRIEDSTYWYVDNLHYGCVSKDGKAAHLEVFDPSGKHIGIADIQTGEINEKYKEDNRTIDL